MNEPRNHVTRPGWLLDLYACAGGWDEGARLAGVGPVVGIEIEHDPCRTAVAAGHPRIRADVATYPTALFVGKVAGLVASPPCQAWSSAGKRLGEKDRARVHGLVDRYATGDRTAEWAWAEAGWADPDSHHAAQPVRWIRDLRPPWLALEQVPPVLPLWQHIARVIRPWGYTTWCGILNAADHGVPQTRQRAFLLATRTGAALPPEPTHAKDPAEGLFGTRRGWVSMAEALGWDGVDRPARTVCGDRSPRWAYGEGNSYDTGWTLRGNQKPDSAANEYQRRPAEEPAQTISTQPHLYRWVETENRTETREGRQPYLRGTGEPAPTVVTNSDRWELHTRRDGPGWVEEHGERADRGVGEAAPTVTGEAHRWSLRNGTQENACERRACERRACERRACERRACEPAGTLFFGHHLNDVRFHSGDESRRITVTEAAALQSFPTDYPWQGTKTSVFSQIGNAVPPVLAAAVIGAVAELSTRSAVAA